ncbi:hypothetical protein [Streptomyces cavernicola]|uniref:Uncharacterized protein n=1 Tax=Streptomyces cavernicola TaxID=3043613 RepID=A0ABT6SDS8_9ACTN|nr:hypothetical protein [Streptomyces sp. B-S-A6]MDI3406341.1 hypothetical protein [Streptomyces sp. B-S-A6]
MPNSYAHGPAPSASVIKIGGEAMGQAAKGAAGCSIFAVLFIGGGLAAVLGLNGEPHNGGYGAIAVGLIAVILAVLFLKGGWDGRKAFLAVDHVGLWVKNPAGGKVVPWDTLAGVGLYWSNSNKKGVGTEYSLELCPDGPIDRDHPVLWNLVRDEEPLHPNLPRLRYRIPIGKKNQPLLVAAVRQNADHLWFGEVQRQPNHIGFPDVQGHKERTQSSR